MSCPAPAAERGAVVPLVALVVVLLGVLCLGLGRLGGRAVEAARARTAADAGALAGAAAGEEAARDVVAANGATVADYRAVDGQVEVVARVGATSARARAARRPGAHGGGATTVGLAPELLAAVRRAEALLGEAIPITSGWRSAERQRELWEARHTNPYPVARPGTSRHEHGLAIDVAVAFAPRVAAVASEAGLCYPYPRTDPVHFELCPSELGRP